MNDMTTTNREAIIGKAIPSLFSKDLDETKSFYQRLGFAVSGEWGAGDDLDWIELKRDQMVLQFYREPPQGTPANPIMSGTLYFEVRALDELADAFSKVTPLEWGPERMDYGQNEFAIRDPNGYLMAFLEP